MAAAFQFQGARLLQDVAGIAFKMGDPGARLIERAAGDLALRIASAPADASWQHGCQMAALTAAMDGSGTLCTTLAAAVHDALLPLCARLLLERVWCAAPALPDATRLDWWRASERLPARFASPHRLTPLSLLLLGKVCWIDDLLPRLPDSREADRLILALSGALAEIAAGANAADQARMFEAIAEALPDGALPALPETHAAVVPGP